MTIYSGFTLWKWWFSIVMLVYQRVNHNIWGVNVLNLKCSCGQCRLERLKNASEEVEGEITFSTSCEANSLVSRCQGIRAEDRINLGVVTKVPKTSPRKGLPLCCIRTQSLRAHVEVTVTIIADWVSHPADHLHIMGFWLKTLSNDNGPCVRTSTFLIPQRWAMSIFGWLSLSAILETSGKS